MIVSPVGRSCAASGAARRSVAASGLRSELIIGRESWVEFVNRAGFQRGHVDRRILMVIAVPLSLACSRTSDSSGGANVGKVEGTRIASAPPNNNAGEWLLPGRDYSNSRYSELSQITPANAANLRVSWTFSTGVLRGHEGQPLVVNNTMYLITPYPNVAYALDLTQPGFPLKWKYRPENAQAAVGIACCDVVNRGASYSDGKIVYNLLDGHTVAVDAATGTELWRVKMGDIHRGETITMAPIVVKGKVIVGSSGGEMGVRGWIAAIDAVSGREAWRAYNIGH